MGCVFEAFDPELRRSVALKLMHPSARPHRHLRVRREARALAHFSHPNIVEIYDAGTYQGQLFLAMERLDGPTLRQWQDHPGRSSSEIVAAYREAARGLEAMHRAGLVHRDFKADNVVWSSDGRLRVVDLGLATFIEGDPEPITTLTGSDLDTLSGPITRTGRLLGTPAYMAPEVWAGSPATAATDQWALCVALYEALTGEHPVHSQQGVHTSPPLAMCPPKSRSIETTQRYGPFEIEGSARRCDTIVMASAVGFADGSSDAYSRRFLPARQLHGRLRSFFGDAGEHHGIRSELE